MSNSLYKSCLRKIAINLREDIYKSCHENPFSFMPSKIVNDIMSAALNHQRVDGIRVEDLEQLLTSGKLRELKMPDMCELLFIPQLETINRVLHLLTSGCQELETLHLPAFDALMDWLRSRVSVARTRAEAYAAILRSEISAALENVFRKSANLKDLHCPFSFDLKTLRNCRKLRKLSLHFHPEQYWYEFLEEEGGHIQTHEGLEFFTVCEIYHSNPMPIPYHDVSIILRHCPGLTSLGFLESSGVLSQLPSNFESNLRHCYWRDVEYDWAKNSSRPPNTFFCGVPGASAKLRSSFEANLRQRYWRDVGYDWAENASGPPEHVLHRIEEAVKKYPMVEALDFNRCCSRSISCLKNLKNLVCLDILCDVGVSGTAFIDAIQAIGPQLKHLSFTFYSQMDLSLLLQKCPNLESLKIHANKFTEFAFSSVSLPNLQHLILNSLHVSAGRVFRILSDCNKLTEMLLLDASFFGDQALHSFLERNSLSRLKVASLPWCSLTENGFRDFLLNAPLLKKVHIFSWDLQFRAKHYRRAITAANNKARFSDGENLLLAECEIFQKKSGFYICSKS